MGSQLFGLRSTVTLWDVALVRYFLRVHNLVLVEFPCCSDALGTLLTLARLFGGVTLHVGVEPSQMSADFAALGAFLRAEPLDEIGFLILSAFLRNRPDG